MAKVYLGLGTNLGDKEQNLRDAVQKIEEQVGKVVSLSAFYVTAPWGFASENSFLNAAACVETELSPLEVLQETQMIERELGRTKKSVNGIYSDRLIDIDLLLYEDLVLSVISASGAELTLPHPLMAERDFVMKPLAEIAPGLVHPVLGKTMKELTSFFLRNKHRQIGDASYQYCIQQMNLLKRLGDEMANNGIDSNRESYIERQHQKRF